MYRKQLILTLQDEFGSAGSDADKNPVIPAVKRIKAEFPCLTVACDVCLCPYTSHGHCGVLQKGT